MGRSATCVALSLCETCQTCVLRVWIWVWNLQLPPVLTLPLYLRFPAEQDENQGTLPGGVASSLGRNSKSQLWLRLFRGSKTYMEGFIGLTWLCDATWRDVTHVLGQTLIPDSKTWVLGEATTLGDEGAQNHSSPYWEPSGSHNRATLPDVFLKDSSKCALTLNYAKFPR